MCDVLPKRSPQAHPSEGHHVHDLTSTFSGKTLISLFPSHADLRGSRCGVKDQWGIAHGYRYGWHAWTHPGELCMHDDHSPQHSPVEFCHDLREAFEPSAAPQIP
jgi:hypothetical protein